MVPLGGHGPEDRVSGCVRGDCGANCPHGSLSFAQVALGLVVLWLFLILETVVQAEAFNPEQMPEGEPLQEQ